MMIACQAWMTPREPQFALLDYSNADLGKRDCQVDLNSSSWTAEFCKATATGELATAFASKHRLLLSNAQVQQQQANNNNINITFLSSELPDAKDQLVRHRR